jgi:DNA-binding NarL/FixJ family response regulator
LKPNRLVILSNHSLFAEGVASRLLQYPERVDVCFVDPQQADYLEKIKENRPTAVIIDAADTHRSQCCLLCDLLMALANVTIIRLEVQHKDIQVVTSSQHPLTEVKDILDIIEQLPHMLGL